MMSAKQFHMLLWLFIAPVAIIGGVTNSLFAAFFSSLAFGSIYGVVAGFQLMTDSEEDSRGFGWAGLTTLATMITLGVLSPSSSNSSDAAPEATMAVASASSEGLAAYAPLFAASAFAVLALIAVIVVIVRAYREAPEQTKHERLMPDAANDKPALTEAVSAKPAAEAKPPLRFSGKGGNPVSEPRTQVSGDQQGLREDGGLLKAGF